jgi:hypothetical protein
MSDDEPLDLSTLRATDPRGAEERVVRSVMGRIRADARERGARRSGMVRDRDLSAFIARRSVPILAGAALVGIAAGLVLATSLAASMRPATARTRPSAAVALGIDPVVASWLARPTMLPTATEILTSFPVRR